MYYNSEKNNNDYYNTYKQEMEEIEEHSTPYSLEKIIKIGLLLLILGGAGILAKYIVDYFSTQIQQETLYLNKKNSFSTNNNSDNNKNQELPTVQLSQSQLPKSIQLQESDAQNKPDIPDTYHANAVSQKDISLIVQIILSQMNHTKEVSLEEQISLAEERHPTRQKLNKSNHYNKIIVSNTAPYTRDNKQVQLKEQLNLIINGNHKNSSNYEMSIRKEIKVRSNEMRIIIVQKGDTLSKIAKKAYGNRDAYPKIFTANPEVLENPNEIFVGQRLRIPA